MDSSIKSGIMENEQRDKEETFEQKLTYLLNLHSFENDSNTPDFILAQYMKGSLKIFNTAVRQRENWYGRDPQDPQKSNNYKNE